MMRRTLVGMVAVAFLAASCSGDDDAATTAESTPDTAAPTTEAADDSPEPDTTEAITPDSTTEPQEATTTEPEPAAEPFLPVPDSDPVVLTTATSGGGTRPLLAWEPVDGAASYLVIVFTEAGEPYWSTITDRTETYVGGAAAIPEGVDGPQIAEGYSWAVYAEDADGLPIASSPIRSIAP